MDHEPGRLLENLIRSSVDGVFAFDRDCRVVLWSAAMERISGVGASDAVGRDVVDLFPFLAEAGEDACLQAALRGETAVAADRLYTDHETGHRAYFEAQYSPLYDGAGEVAGGIGLLRDITHRKRSEANATGLLREQIARHEAERLSAALRHSEERYRAFFAHSAEGIWLAELDEPLDVTLPPDAQVDHFFRCSYLAECNDAMARMYGYARADEIVGARLGELLPPSDPSNIDYLRAFVASNYRLENAESHEVDREGRPKYFQNNLVGIVENGLMLRAWGTQRDVTDLVAAAAERDRILEAERRARAEAERAAGLHRDAEDRLTVLVEASRLLLGSLDLDAVQPAILDLSRRLISADGHALWRRERAPEGLQWRMVSAAGISTRSRKQTVSDDESRNPLLERPFVAEDVFSTPELAERYDIYRAEGIKALLSVPVRIHGEISGTMTFYYRQTHGFDEIEVTVATALANLAGAAISVAELYEEQSQLRAGAEEAERRSKFLAEATALLGSSLDYESTLARVANLVVPDLADWCTVDITDDGGAVVRLAVAHKDPEKVAWARRLQEQYPPRPDDPRGVAKVLRTGEPELYAEITDELLVATARDDEQLALMRGLGIASAMIVPLLAHGRTLGAITFVSVESGRHYGPADLAFAEDLAGRAAGAVENARLYGEAQEARQRAEEANRLKDEFLATMSHELRTPLNAIVGWSRMMLARDLDDGTARRGLEAIDRNARAQAQIVDDVLDVSRIITGKLRLEPRPVGLGSVIDAAVASVRPAAEAKGVRLEVDVAADAGLVSGDPDRLQQIVWNLLANAVKFTPGSGRVWVRLRRAGSHAEVEVGDTGAGIEPAFLPFVFDRFRQADSSTTRRHGGLGLGLAIVRQLVEMHGGTVEATSAGAGRGSIFVVRLPVAAEDAPARDDVCDGEAQGGAAARKRPSLEGLRVLVVDDEPDARDLIATLLSACKAEVETAATAGEALEAIGRRAPDVLVSDIGMPGEDGYALIRKIRHLEAATGGYLPAVALTAYARAEDRTRALDTGYDLHVSKPVDPHALVAALATLREQRH